MSNEPTPADFAAGLRVAQSRADMRARAEATVRDMESSAVRITTGDGGRCFQMADGRLFTIHNEPQPTDGDIVRMVAVMPIAVEDAQDFYGWTNA